MNLYLLRHADAEPLGFNGIKKDEQRPLTDFGKKQAKRVGMAIKKLDLKLDYILTSPYDRARQTAELVAEQLKLLRTLDESDALLPSAAPSKLLKELKEYEPDTNLLVVGHQPDLGELVSYFVWGQDSIEIPIKKAGMACLEILDFSNSIGQSSLQWLLTYDQLAMLLK